MKLYNVFVYGLAFAVVLIMLLLVISTTTDVMRSATGDNYNEADWFIAEQYVCAKEGLTAIQYIGQSCSLFGCIDVEKTKCVGENIEKKIDYDDPIFCQYSMKEDFGWC